MKTQIPSAWSTGHFTDFPPADAGGKRAAKVWPSGFKGQRTIRKKSLKVKEVDAPWKSCKGGDRLSNQRSNSMKAINEKKHSMERALPALAASSGFVGCFVVGFFFFTPMVLCSQEFVM